MSMHHHDWSDWKGGLVGFVLSWIASAALFDLAVQAITAFILGGIGALGGIVVSRLWKKYVDKKQ